MKFYILTATLLVATSLLQAQTVDIDIYNNTGYDVRLERNYLPGTPQPAPIAIDATRNIYNPVILRNQDLDRLVNYTLSFAGSRTPVATINAEELAQRAAQVGANALIITLEPTGYLTTSGIKTRITARGKAQPSRGATQPVSEEDDFEKIGETLEEFEPVSG